MWRATDHQPWWGIFAPAQRRPVVVERLMREIEKIGAIGFYHKQLAPLGATLPGRNDGCFCRVREERDDKWRKVVKAAGSVLD